MTTGALRDAMFEVFVLQQQLRQQQQQHEQQQQRDRETFVRLLQGVVRDQRAMLRRELYLRAFIRIQQESLTMDLCQLD